MADEHHQKEEERRSRSFPDNYSRGPEGVFAEHESSDERSDDSGAPVSEPNSRPDCLLMQRSKLHGERRPFPSRAKTRGTLSMSNGSSMEPVRYDTELSFTDGTADGEQQSIISNCEVATQTDMFLPKTSDVTDSEESPRKADEISEEGEDQNNEEESNVTSEGQSIPLVIIVKANEPKSDNECLFYSDCGAEDAQHRVVPSLRPVKESIICEQRDNMNILHCLYHKLHSPTLHAIEEDCEDCGTINSTPSSLLAHPARSEAEINNIHKTKNDFVVRRKVSSSGDLMRDASSDCNELPVSEEFKKLGFMRKRYDEDRPADSLTVRRLLPSEPDYTMESIFGDVLYYPRFNERNEKPFFMTGPYEREYKADKTSGAEESDVVPATGETLGYRPNQLNKHVQQSEFVNIQHCMEFNSSKPHTMTFGSNNVNEHNAIADQKKYGQIKEIHEQIFDDTSYSDRSQLYPSRSTGGARSHDKMFSHNDAFTFESTQSYASSTDKSLSGGKTFLKKTPSHIRATADEWHFEDDNSGKDTAVPTEMKWVDKFSEATQEEKKGPNEVKKKGKLRQMYKYVKDRFKGKR